VRPGRAVVWLDGGLADPDVASVHWSDHGLTVGDGVFETIELRRGRPFALGRHLTRLQRSSTGLGITCPAPGVVREAVDAVASAWGTSPGRLRITVTSGPGPMGSGRTAAAAPTLLVAAGDMRVLEMPTPVVTVPFTRNERGALAGLKTTSYAENVLALARADAAGAGEAIFGNTVGALCEGTGSNVFVGIGGSLLTPPLASGCLAGVTRELLLEALEAAGCPALVENVPMDRLVDVEEMFLVSTGRHVQPVSRLDGRALDCPGSLTARASRVWHRAYDESIDP
jgi:branched-chain amino acid aminotransferase